MLQCIETLVLLASKRYTGRAPYSWPVGCRRISSHTAGLTRLMKEMGELVAKRSPPEILIEIFDADPHLALRDARRLHEELKRAGVEPRLQRRAGASNGIITKGAPTTDIIALAFSGMNLSIAAAQFWRMRRPGRRLSITRGDDILEIYGERIEDTREVIERFLQMDSPSPPAINSAGDLQLPETS